jgi:hypothetical protein
MFAQAVRLIIFTVDKSAKTDLLGKKHYYSMTDKLD